MQHDDWITKLFIMENLNKNKFTVPVKLGWLTPNGEYDEHAQPVDYIVDWRENVQNYSKEQCLFLADVISDEFKQVDDVYDETMFFNNFIR